MKKMEKIKNDIFSFASKLSVKAKKHAPEILIISGAIGTIAGAIVACKATIKAKDLIEEAKDQISDVKEVSEDEQYSEKYSEKDRKHDLALIYIQTGLKFVKLYSPAIIIEAASLAMIFASNNVLRKRVAAIGAAYATLDGSFKAYRKRVAEKYGEEAETAIRYGIESKEIEDSSDENSGKKKKSKTKADVAKVIDDYSIVFDHEHSKAWEPDNDYNYTLISAEQSYANDILKSRGHLFLNEVYDRLGIARTKMGQIVGWVYKPDDENWKGDNFVDFRTKELYIDDPDGRPVKKIVLDFNIDGNVLDLI